MNRHFLATVVWVHDAEDYTGTNGIYNEDDSIPGIVLVAPFQETETPAADTGRALFCGIPEGRFRRFTPLPVSSDSQVYQLRC
jgi:hypothetical protein